MMAQLLALPFMDSAGLQGGFRNGAVWPKWCVLAANP
jgi:hypothetical protein